MSVVQVPNISYYILGYIGALYLLPHVDTTVRFTHFPPSVLYVSSGGTARFVWDYHVDDRRLEFQSNSPVWSYKKGSNEWRIGSDDKYTNNWSFVINRATCPPRLLNPDRVSREYNASLVITDVTTADSGIYRCSLIPKAGDNINHQVQLVVTVRPVFLPSRPNISYQVFEGQKLKINCTAIGPPTPNITWVNITDGSIVTISQGSGSAVLQIDNIRRYHAGVYKCQAKNNPNEDPITTRTSVTVYYKPTISKELSSSDSTSWNGRQVTLRCTVRDGLPTPDITWYKPSGQQITTGVTAIAKGSQVTMTTKDGADYGSYKCKATNIAGHAEQVIIVTQLFPPGAPNLTILDQDTQASSVIVRWTKPGYDGGSTVIDYKVQINTNPILEHNTSNTEHELTGLIKNTRYEVKVYARNVVGYGNASIISFTTKKRGPPPLPILHLIKSKATITLAWTKPDENGGEIKEYTIYQKQGVEKTWVRIHIVRDLSNLTYVIHVKDLEPGQTYWFIVTATNEFGESEIGDDKGKEAYILPKPVTPATQATTTGIGGQSRNKSDEQEKCSATALAVCAAFLAVSLIVIVLLLLYIWRNIKRKEQTVNTDTKSTHQYENDKEMRSKAKNE